MPVQMNCAQYVIQLLRFIYNVYYECNYLFRRKGEIVSERFL